MSQHLAFLLLRNKNQQSGVFCSDADAAAVAAAALLHRLCANALLDVVQNHPDAMVDVAFARCHVTRNKPQNSDR
jgi:hypothetical protein